LLAASFGTAKAQREVEKYRANQIDDDPKDGKSGKKKKGAMDSRLQPLAEDIQQKNEVLKKELASMS
jgi:hypothetical protein